MNVYMSRSLPQYVWFSQQYAWQYNLINLVYYTTTLYVRFIPKSISWSRPKEYSENRCHVLWLSYDTLVRIAVVFLDRMTDLPSSESLFKLPRKTLRTANRKISPILKRFSNFARQIQFISCHALLHYFFKDYPTLVQYCVAKLYHINSSIAFFCCHEYKTNIFNYQILSIPCLPQWDKIRSNRRWRGQTARWPSRLRSRWSTRFLILLGQFQCFPGDLKKMFFENSFLFVSHSKKVGPRSWFLENWPQLIWKQCILTYEWTIRT